jgi:hypothetical protein
MKCISVIQYVIVCALLVVIPPWVRAQGTAFTYQGRLNDGASPANGNYDVRFALYDAANAGNQQGNLLTNSPTTVTNGLFTVTLDFGNQFPGAARWLEIAVRSNGVGGFTILAPRQPLTPTPYAITSGQLSPGTGLAGTYSGAVTMNNAANSFAGTFTGNGMNVSNVNALTLGGLGVGQLWQLGGNAGTTSVSNYLGTSDNQPLELHVNGSRALRLEPNVINGAPNFIAGSSINYVSNGIIGATIGGGGVTNLNLAYESGNNLSNSVSGNFGTVGGGYQNSAANDLATVGGGRHNTASGMSSVIGGGAFNIASNNAAAVGGGQGNTASGQGSVIGGGAFNIASNAYATVSGGEFNTAGGVYATVPGGHASTASGIGSVIGGGELNTAIGLDATVGGGHQNTNSGDYGTVGGGLLNTASNFAATVGGGAGNIASGVAATVPGGEHNTASGGEATVGGGYENTASGDYSFAAGQQAEAIHQGAFVWADSQSSLFVSTANDQFSVRARGGVRLMTSGAGLTVDGSPALTSATLGITIQPNINGAPNFISGSSINYVSNGIIGATIGGGGATNLNLAYENGNNLSNSVSGNFGTVSGGYQNSAASDLATVGGGRHNTASGKGSVIGGGEFNGASNADATVGGGSQNTVSGYQATIGGGSQNTASGISSVIGGGSQNTVGGDYEAIGGGIFNSASGQFATVSGGYFNTASGDYSFAAGQQAQALHQGAFVWADSQNAAFASTANDQFLIRAQGGVGIGITNPASLLDVGGRMRLRGDTFTTAGVWLNRNSPSSDRAFMGMLGDGFVGFYGMGSSWNLVMNVTNGNVGIANQNPTHAFQVASAYCDGTTWVNGSDRNSKLNFAAVNPREVLDKVAAMPITEWQYKVAPGREHIGPMAQDFHVAFGLNGADDKHIADVDEGGVALAAIQGLNQKLEDQQAENAELKKRLAALETLVKQLAQNQQR